MGVECNFDWGKFGARGVILLPQIICSSRGPVESERERPIQVGRVPGFGGEDTQLLQKRDDSAQRSTRPRLSLR